MSYNHGPLDEFEVIWTNGHIDRIRAHQVTYERGLGMFDAPQRVTFHGELNGHWKLVLSMPYSDVLTIRNVTQIEVSGD